MVGPLSREQVNGFNKKRGAKSNGQTFGLQNAKCLMFEDKMQSFPQ